MIEEINAIEWLAPWGPCSHPEFVTELRKEVAAEHPLFGRKAITVGIRDDCDDVLFYLPDGPSPLAVVHLTWKGRTESNPVWPGTSLYSSLEDWIERCMKPDHREFQTAC